ncbi:hypothetical protein [Stutzerimonas stutzeri]|uniref:hypothetical protein n=1 Tax=Stutzerimonas stutzeri TaxID=316 RepID=UPI0012D3B984|nr:hypothetical protein [Stutzerimonas stutzeri]
MSALAVVLFLPVPVSYLSNREVPVVLQIILVILAMTLLLAAWATSPRFRENLLAELPSLVISRG